MAAKTFARIAVPAPIYPIENLLDYKIPEEFFESVGVGSLVRLSLGRQKTWGIVFETTGTSEYPAQKLKTLTEPVLSEAIFSAERLKFLRWMARHYLYPLGEVCEAAIPGPVRDASPSIVKKEMARLAERLEKAKPHKVKSSAYSLNVDQARALEQITGAGFDSHSAHLLWGITGSGKTEVYLQAIEKVLGDTAKGAIVLVPEIALTPQLTDRFEERFPGQVSIFHSNQSPVQLRKAWFDVWSGQKRIAIGARSALFAPVPQPGIVIVDEEHDSSYKQEERLRYHAREGALRLAQEFSCPVVLGSATPSAETLARAANNELIVSRLPSRASGQAVLPSIEIVDLKKNIAIQNKNPEERSLAMEQIELSPALEGLGQGSMPRGSFFLSDRLLSELSVVLDQKKQAILFLNRRGLASQEFCRTCGFVAECPDCDVKLTPHHHKLLCHYCGFETQTPKKCSECGNSDDPFIRMGVGTEAIEEALQAQFPHMRLARLDRDTVQGAGDLEKVVGDFAAGKADVLIGTQMVAKGHDFPGVTLVGILLADLGLSVPDFRAYERSLQLLLQVSGRAGRGLHPGRVIVQTFQPEHPVLQAVAGYRGLDDYEKFLSLEISKRKDLLYPPHGSLAMLRLDGLTVGEVQLAAELVARGLRKIDGKRISVLGPVPSPLSKLRNRHRWQILVKAAKQDDLARALSWVLDTWTREKLEAKTKSRLIVDVDPFQMM